MTCPTCDGHDHTGYIRGRPQPCRKCAGTGWITPKHPQRPAPAPPFAALIP
jgi:DnaJ-class molecular chaperone